MIDWLRSLDEAIQLFLLEGSNDLALDQYHAFNYSTKGLHISVGIGKELYFGNALPVGVKHLKDVWQEIRIAMTS